MSGEEVESEGESVECESEWAVSRQTQPALAQENHARDRRNRSGYYVRERSPSAHSHSSVQLPPPTPPVRPITNHTRRIQHNRPHNGTTDHTTAQQRRVAYRTHLIRSSASPSSHSRASTPKRPVTFRYLFRCTLERSLSSVAYRRQPPTRLTKPFNMSYNPAYAYAPAQPVAIAAPYQGPHYSMQQQQQQPVQYAPSPPIRAQQQAAYLPSQPQHFHNSAIRPPTFQPVQAAPVGLAPTVTKPYTQCIAVSD